MRSYNNKNWFEVFSLYRADTLRLLWPMLFIVALYTLGVDYFLSAKSDLTASPVLRNLTIVHTLLGLVISLLLVFRTNTAYDRWWEGRKLWGSLVNNSRNLALRLNAILESNNQKDRDFFKRMIPLYASVLDKHLKSPSLAMSLDDSEHPELAEVNMKGHVPNQVAASLMNRIYALHKEGLITKEELLTLTSESGSFTDICGACERIKNTPIPYSYSSFIKRFIVLYVGTLPWSLAANLGFWSIPVVLFVMYALSSLEVIAEEIEEPFGIDPNDLPTEKMAENIGKNVREILG
jgi:ion channel-forming bestrophin family protein